VVVYVPLGVLLVAVKLVAVDQHASALVEPGWDPSESLARGSLWVVGLAGWSWAVRAATVGWARLRRSAQAQDQARARARMLAGAGVLSALMFADDLWQLHKPVIPDATGLGSGVVLAVYAALFALWLWSSRAEIARTDVGILTVALGFFALWLAAKGAPGIPGRVSLAAGAKLCGIAGWAAYLTRAAAGPTATPRRASDPDRA